MKLKAVVDDLNEVDEKYRDLYVEQTVGDATKFVLQVDGFRSHPDVTALSNAHERTKQANRTLTQEKTTLEQKLAALPDDFDLEAFDPDLYQRALDGNLGGGDTKDVEERIRQATEAAVRRAEDKAGKDKLKVEQERDRYKSTLENKIKREAVDEALEACGITDPALRKGARALTMGLVEIHQDGDELVALVKSPEYGDTIPVAEHVKAWAQTDEGKAYVSARDSAGGGANGGGSGGKPPASNDNPWKADTINFTRQAAIEREDPTLALKLKREAGISV